MQPKNQQNNTYYQPKFSIAFLHPRFWVLWLLFSLMAIGIYLPNCLRRMIGAGFGNLYRLLNHKRRRTSLINLKLCFPEMNNAERDAMMRAHFHCHGQGVFDYAVLWWASEKHLRQLVRFNGMHNLQQAYNIEQPIIFLTYHSVNTDFVGIILALLYKDMLFKRMEFLTLMKPVKNPLLDYFLCKGRRRFVATNLQLRDWGLAKIAHVLRRNKDSAFFYIPDEDFGPDKSVFAPFFGTQVATINLLGRLADISNAIVLPVSAFLSKETGGYDVYFDEPLQNALTGVQAADAATMNQAFERMIKRHPEQYMWTMRCFRTRPSGEPSPYL